MSNINHEKKRIFIHLPKCAGSSMEALDWNRGSGHNTIYDYSKTVNLDEYFKWCFVRNPWDRIVSAYEDCPEVNRIVTTFKEFIDTIYKNKSGFDIVDLSYGKLPYLGLPVGRIHFFPLTKQLTLNGEIKIDFIGRYEKLSDDWKKLVTIVNESNSNLPHVNARKGKPLRKNTFYKDMYTQELIDKVAELYADDIKNFSYDYV